MPEAGLVVSVDHQVVDPVGHHPGGQLAAGVGSDQGGELLPADAEGVHQIADGTADFGTEFPDGALGDLQRGTLDRERAELRQRQRVGVQRREPELALP